MLEKISRDCRSSRSPFDNLTEELTPTIEDNPDESSQP